MNILAINTTDQVLGVALVKHKQIIAEHVTNLRKGHAERLMPAIVHLMDEVNWKPENLDKIVVAKGPGSYTGVRIGLTTAKTLAWSLNIPIVGISSIFALAYQAQFSSDLICPFFDARRNRVYTGLFKWVGDRLQVVEDEQNIAIEKWLENLSKLKETVVFLSPNISLYKEMIQRVLGVRALFARDPYAIIRPSHLVLASQHVEETDVHKLVPNYLRLAEAEANWLKQKEANNE